MCLSDFRRIAYMTKFNCISFTGARNQSQLLMAIVMFFLASYAFGSLPLHSGRNNNVEIHAKRLLLKKNLPVNRTPAIEELVSSLSLTTTPRLYGASAIF